MADTPRELDRVNSILITDDVLASGPRTPWSPIRGLTGRRPGPIAATRLLDLGNEGFERPAEYSGRGGATRSSAGREFHDAGPEKEKARSPTLVRGRGVV